MRTFEKEIIIHSTPEKVFAQMDDFSKTGMHMSESSVMMMGSKLTLEQLSPNQTGVDARYRWRGKMMGMTIDLSETVTKWQQNKLKEWETDGGAKIIIMSWYRMWFEITPDQNGTITKLSISYLQPMQWFYKILSFLFAKWYCNWCLNNMLNDSKKNLEGKVNKSVGFQYAWVIFFVLSLALMIISLQYIFYGHSLEPKANAAVQRISAISADLGNFVKEILRVFGLSWFTWGFLSAAISITAYRKREMWAWYAFWIMPIYEIGDGWIDHAGGGSTGWIPMVIAGALIVTLLVSPQFFHLVSKENYFNKC